MSILNTVKKTLGIEATYTAFDVDIILHINSVFGTLNQLGIGPEAGFAIEDATATWVDFLVTDTRLNPVKTYIYLRVRLLFDPPTSSYHIDAMKEQIQELEWRLSTYREQTGWTDPTVLSSLDEEYVMDGGAP